jgi:hypothetical protein
VPLAVEHVVVVVRPMTTGAVFGRAFEGQLHSLINSCGPTGLALRPSLHAILGVAPSCQQADVPRRLQARPLPDPRERLLRMAADAGRQAALLHQRGGRLRALDGRAMGSMDGYRDGCARPLVHDHRDLGQLAHPRHL